MKTILRRARPVRISRWSVGVALAATLALTPHLRGQDVGNEIAELRRQIAALDQKLRVLERQREIEAEEAAARAKTQPTLNVGQSGFSAVAADKAWEVRIRANVQLDGRYFLDDDGNNTNDRFLLRRVRPSLEGRLGDKFTFRIMPDFAPDNVELLETYGVYKFADSFNVLFGKTKSPVGLERLVSQTNLIFVERGYPTTLLPNRDVGVQFFGQIFEQRLDWNLSVLNGTLDNSSSGATPPDDQFELAGRLFAHPFRQTDGVLKGLGIGVSGTYGIQENTAPARYRTTAQQNAFSWIDKVQLDGAVSRLSPQGYWYYGPFSVLAEYAISAHDVVRTDTRARDTLNTTAWMVYGTWVVTGEDASYAGVKPDKPVSFSDGTWGAWEIALRWNELDIDNDSFPIFANPASSVTHITGTTFGLNWYWNRNFKINLNYDWNRFDGGAPAGADKPDEHAIFSRLQLNF